jgi:putative aldouronate transport system substrate-binding protein
MGFQSRVNRRGFFAGAAGLGLAAAGGALTGCGSDDAPAGGSPTGAGSTPSAAGSSASAATGGPPLPAYVPYEAVTSDQPATKDGASPFFTHYPADPPVFSTTPPASGDAVTALCIIPSPVKSVDGNAWWKELDRQLGTKLQFVGAPNENYPQKVATVVAGNQIPDVAQLYASTPDLPGLLGSKFADLTDYLAGDKVKQYPGLANIPEYCWQSAIYNGKLYGVPLQRTPVAYWACVRAESAKAAGVNPQPASGEEFIEICKALTNTKKNQWALRGVDKVQGWVNQMVGVPNTWAVDNGKFTSAYETDQYAQALGIVRQLWDAGYFEPDTLTETNALIGQWYASGRVSVMVASASWSTLAGQLQDAGGGDSAPIIPPRWEGGGMAKQYLTAGILTITSVKQASEARVQELLRVLDWLCAPFGTAEYKLKWYGVEGVDYEKGATDPVTNDTGKAEWPRPSIYVANAPTVHYNPKYPDIAKLEYDNEATALANSLAWPLSGLYSATDQTTGATLQKNMQSAALDIMVGRKPVSAWTDAVKSWRSGGGEKIRGEYQAAAQAVGQ